jgi:hypothetical protein
MSYGCLGSSMDSLLQEAGASALTVSSCSLQTLPVRLKSRLIVKFVFY